MQFTIVLLLVCQVLGQDEGDVEGGTEGEVDDHGPSQPAVSILSHHQELGDDGTFKYSFSADNGLQQREAFHPDGSRTGAYSYIDPRGETVLVHYRADKYGFHVLDGSSIPTTPPLAGRQHQQAYQPNQEEGQEGQEGQEGPESPRDAGGPETSSYEVEEPEGEGSASDGPPAQSTAAQPPAAPGPFGFEMTRAPNMPGLHNRFYRSAARELFSEAIVADHKDLDSIAAEDLSGAASSHYGIAGYVPVEQSRSAFKSPYASLARQIQYPVQKGAAEAEVEPDDVRPVVRPNDGGREQAAATDNGDYRLHAGRHDDGSYAQHAQKYDDGSYQQHAVKYDDGSYGKYANLYGEGQYNEPSGQHNNEDEEAGRAEYEAASLRQPEEEEVRQPGEEEVRQPGEEEVSPY